MPDETRPTGVDLIATERARQVQQEGWTPEHDDAHLHGEIIAAARSYAMAAERQVCGFPRHVTERSAHGWPWELSAWKPSDDPIRNLVKAGALIAAEIDRLQRKAARDAR